MKKVEIKWFDSANAQEWKYGDDEIRQFVQASKKSIKSIGYLYKKTKKYILLVGDIGAWEGKNRIIKIPRGCIKSIKKL